MKKKSTHALALLVGLAMLFTQLSAPALAAGEALSAEAPPAGRTLSSQAAPGQTPETAPTPSAVPDPAPAEEAPVDTAAAATVHKGGFSVFDGEPEKDYTYGDDGILWVKTSTTLTILNTDNSVAPTTDTIRVTGQGTTANIRLWKLNIVSDNSPIYLETGTTANITITGNTQNTLHCTGQGAGIEVPKGATLNIRCSAHPSGTTCPGDDTCNPLTIITDGRGAGIGGAGGTEDMDIYGGVVGIGGPGADAGDVTIRGGRISITAPEIAIGGGTGGDGAQDNNTGSGGDGGPGGAGANLTVTGGSIQIPNGGIGGGNGGIGGASGGRSGDDDEDKDGNGGAGGAGGTLAVSAGQFIVNGGIGGGIGGSTDKGAAESGNPGKGGQGTAITHTGGLLTVGGAIGGGASGGTGVYGVLGAPGSLTVNGNAWLSAKEINADPKTLTTCIVFDGDVGAVYGNPTIPRGAVIGEGQTLTIPEDHSVTLPKGVVLVNYGTLKNSSKLLGKGKISNKGKSGIYNMSMFEPTVIAGVGSTAQSTANVAVKTMNASGYQTNAIAYRSACTVVGTAVSMVSYEDQPTALPAYSVAPQASDAAVKIYLVSSTAKTQVGTVAAEKVAATWQAGEGFREKYEFKFDVTAENLSAVWSSVDAVEKVDPVPPPDDHPDHPDDVNKKTLTTNEQPSDALNAAGPYSIQVEFAPGGNLLASSGSSPLYVQSVHLITLTLDAMGGACAESSLRIPRGGMVGVLPTPTREGWQFDGWSTVKDDPAKVVPADGTLSSSTTLYAQWSELPEPTPTPTPTPSPTPVPSPTASPKPTASPTPTPVPTPTDKVEAFVTRLYRVCLGRAPDKTGFTGWVAALKDGSKSGRDVMFGFIFSNEFQNKKYANLDFVKQLYRAFMNREGEPTGLTGWTAALDTGAKTRQDVFEGFVGSNEFTEICRQYGITRG